MSTYPGDERRELPAQAEPVTTPATVRITPRLPAWAHTPLSRAGRRQPRGGRVAPRAGPSHGLCGQATTEPVVHFCAAAPVHIPAAVDSTPRRCRRAPAGHPLHPMIAGHSTGQNRAAITAIAVLIAAVFEWDNRGLPAGQRKPFSRPRPRRPKGPGLILSPARLDLAGAARLLCNFHSCGPVPQSTPGSAEAQVLTFGMSSQRVV